jgi:glutamate synthase (NADPH/NADH) large chain
MKAKGLYNPEFEHDACGIGTIINVDGKVEFSLIQDALDMLENMEHRGGTGADESTGDGAGIMLQLTDQMVKNFAEEAKILLNNSLPAGVGMFFFPTIPTVIEACKQVIEDTAKKLNLKVLGYRKVPIDKTIAGAGAKKVEPLIEQIFIQPLEAMSPEVFERKLFVMRNAATHYMGHHVEGNNKAFYVCSLSTKSIVYKGQLRTNQLRPYFKDLQDKRLKSAFAIVHSRFSTNTFPNWKLAQPFRFISHNGEINTIRGNVTKMKSKEARFKSKVFSAEELEMLLPVTNPEHSDSANLDSLVEMLVLDGRPLEQVMMMMVPEAWQNNSFMDKDRKAFYKYFASMMEPWDGPAALIFTDGHKIGATLDRNGLRPARFAITASNRLIIASEAGALKLDEADIVQKGRLQPGKMLMVDLATNKIMFDEEIKRKVANAKPYSQWINAHRIKLRSLPDPPHKIESLTAAEILIYQKCFGYTTEELKVIIQDMAEKATEPLGSMGADTPLAILSKQSQHIANYFKQLFAQVSNPPIDPIRERMVMSLFTRVGKSENILDESPDHARQIHISHPLLFNSDLAKFKYLKDIGYDYTTIECTFKADGMAGRLEEALDKICLEAEQAAIAGKVVLILSDRNIDGTAAPIPSLLSTGAVHQHLVAKNLRTETGIVVEAGDVRETHHFATIIGYGASAINPYLALESIEKLFVANKLQAGLLLKDAFDNYKQAIGYGLLKILSKMGISTLQSYQSAQIFEALGLCSKVVDRCFTGTISRIEGLDFDGLAKEVMVRHNKAFNEHSIDDRLEVGGLYQWKQRGEKHLFNPETIHLLQQSTQTANFELFQTYSEKINNQQKEAITLRSLFEFKKRTAIPLAEVEPVENIIKRFATGAMSFGSISHEAHSTLAIAMNRIGAKSNSGEGGEDEIRFEMKPNGDSERSSIKQVASGRFGVTSYYLANADELQIKMAQGAKPGEGGQLPGHKVDAWIGRVRHSTPGVGLISPPPHHDIYSIEDLAQLIYDLKNANQQARINVKLVSQAGVGTVAAGVSKANADVVLISGADGGTGASPLSSIRHAGLPWELGLAEAHQTLVKNDLRSRITLQADGQMRTARDLAIATLLGAEEWGISTAALVVEGCIMMRKCHTNTCPVGVATQNPELRKLFTGKPEHVVTFFQFLAEDLRQIMASLGFKSINEMVGHSEILRMRSGIKHWKLKDIDLNAILYQEHVPEHIGIYKQIDQDHKLEAVLDRQLVTLSQPALLSGVKVSCTLSIKNTDRAVGAILSHEVSKLYKAKGLADGLIHFTFNGSAGQSFGVFLAKGIHLEVAGESNDYFGKGLSGGQLTIYPPKESPLKAEENIIIGNVAFYGATSGRSFINGMAGERFCVRNSGVTAVVEGVGDHACEYMTGGTVIVLGKTGQNCAAGMSGGIAYILDEDGSFADNCNKSMVSLEVLTEQNDIDQVYTLIEEHLRYTGSAKAGRILAEWANNLAKLIKVIPFEYKRVLQERAVMKEENSKIIA